MWTISASRWTPTRRFWSLGVGALALSIVGAACTSAPDESIDPAAYRAELGAICEQTVATRSERAVPVDAATTTAFAQETATEFRAEADSIRALRPPGDLDDDHRAFIQNTDDQARLWDELSTTPISDTDAFGELQTSILELALGRDDLAGDMGIERCQVATLVGS